MVKREKSPEMVEDVRIYVAWMPFPLNANLDLDEDRKACTLWVIEIVGSDNLINIYHKPSSRGMILLEISKSYEDTRCLLGEHRWSKFLKDPKQEEKVNTTRVYYSIYPTTRAAQKDGWRTVKFSANWFRNWSRGKGRFVEPFPEPSYCLLPPEDRTGKSICRHLPAGLRPPQAQAEASRKPPVVGSPMWVTQNTTKGPGTSVNSSKTTKQNSRPMASSPTSPILSRSATEKSQRPAITSRNAGLSPMSGPSAQIVDFPKGRPMPLQQFRSQGQSSGGKKAWTTSVKRSSSTTVGAEKSLIPEVVPKKPQNAWAKPPLIIPEGPAKVIAPVTGSNWDEPPSAKSWFDMVEEEGNFDTTDTRATSPGSSGSSPHAINVNDIYGDSDSSDNEDQLAANLIVASLERCISSVPSTSRTPDSAGASDKKEKSSPVSADTADDSQDEDQERKDEIQCPSHGKICPKKICRDYKKLEWERKKQEEREARKKKREEREARRAERQLRREHEEEAGVIGNTEDSDSANEVPNASSSDPEW